MRSVLVISLLILTLSSDIVRGGCKDCNAEDNRECVLNECKCTPGYFYNKQSGQCSDSCDNLSTTFTEFRKAMVEQGKAIKEVFLGTADADVEACMEKCTEYKCGCVGFSVKRNDINNKSRCFLYSSTPLEVYEQWRTHKGRWTFYQRDCE